MNSTTRYAAISAILLCAAGGVIAFGFTAAVDFFARSGPQGQPAVAVASDVSRGIGTRPASSLLGAKAVNVDDTVGGPSGPGRWVEVVDAVNMRKGPASATAVIKVQLPGAKLRLASRKGAWLEVVEPKTGGTGWVFEKFVKPIDSVTRRADAGETAVR